MQLIDRFHQLESKNALFELGTELGMPIWDIIRYDIYIKYYYSEKDRENLLEVPQHSPLEYIKLFRHILYFIYEILVHKAEFIALTASRYIDANGKYFDKSAAPILDILGDNCLVIEPITVKKTTYKYIYDFSCILRKIFPTKKFPYGYFTKINDILVADFDRNLISYQEINKIYNNFLSDYFFYKLIFSIKKTKKLVISTGNPKASLLAAKDLNITTYLVQHAGIEFDEIDYSYPKGITHNSNILFSKYLLTLGDYWCKNLNVPTQDIIPIGNDFFYSKPKVKPDNTILIISTIIHGGELKKITKELAIQIPKLKFIYKLHPNEFHLKDDYIGYFNENINVNVVTIEIETNILIAKSQLVVLIVSAVIYEALNQNKKVAILKRINYLRQLTLSQFANVYFFDLASEIPEILTKEVIKKNVDFYKNTNRGLIKKLFEN